MLKPLNTIYMIQDKLAGRGAKLDPVDFVFFVSLIVVALILVGLTIRRHFRKHDEANKTLPFSLVVGLILITFTMVIFVPYTFNKPATLLTVVTDIALSTFAVGFIGFFLYMFREIRFLDVDAAISKRELGARFGLIFLFYLICSMLIGRGINFLFNGLLNPQLVELTPEFESYAIPAISIFALVVFRITRIFPSKVTEMLEDVSRDIVIFSLLVYWISIVASSVGITIQANLGSLPFQGNAFIYLMLISIGVGFEGLAVWVKQDIKKYPKKFANFSIDEFVHMPVQAFRRKHSVQSKINDFCENHVETKRDRGVAKFEQIVDNRFSRFSIKYRGRVLRASRILFWVMLVFLLSFTGILMVLQAPKNQLVAAPAYFIDLKISPKNQLPTNVTQIVSEDMEFIASNKLYAVPIVSINTSSTSFTAPLSNRFLTLNSSSFFVHDSGDYLTVFLRKGYVETTVSATSIGNLGYHQENNPSFNYIGFFRDAEIFYEFAKIGYNQTVAFSAASSEGMDHSSQQKVIFSRDGNGTSALVIIDDEHPFPDDTAIYSMNAEFLNETAFLLDQTKVTTTVTTSLTNPSAPFKILDNSDS